MMELTDDTTRIKLAIFLLDSRAARWWHDLGPYRAVTWDEFKNEITLPVLPRSVRDKKTYQFTEFKQELSMSVTEYEDWFKELSRYAPLEARSEETLARKFLNELLTNMSRVVTTQSYTTIS